MIKAPELCPFLLLFLPFTESTSTACDHTSEKAGYRVGIYCNVDWYQNVLSTKLKSYDLWLARYPANDDGTVQTRLKPEQGIGWQYSSKGKVAGISGNVDMDLFYKDYKEKAEE